MADPRLARVRSWALFYGAHWPPGLSRHDLLVLAAGGWTAEDLNHLRAEGAGLLLGYLPVLEVPGPAAPAHVLVNEGAPVAQQEWGTWVLDPRHTATSAHVMDAAERLVRAGFDGFFLDTVGDVERPALPPPLRSRLIPAAARLVADLRARYPDRLLMQNWGFGPLLDLTIPYVDALCWEDFPLGPPMPWQCRLAERLTDAARQGPRVFALSLADDPAPPWAAALGFPWYGAPGTYTRFGGDGPA